MPTTERVKQYPTPSPLPIPLITTTAPGSIRTPVWISNPQTAANHKRFDPLGLVLRYVRTKKTGLVATNCPFPGKTQLAALKRLARSGHNPGHFKYCCSKRKILFVRFFIQRPKTRRNENMCETTTWQTLNPTHQKTTGTIFLPSGKLVETCKVSILEGHSLALKQR